MLLMVVLPLNVLATDFKLSGTDMQITFDESEWYVFTPDNILDNPELEELGISYDYMVDSFRENKASVDAVLFYADSEDQHNTRHEQSMGGKETQSTRIEQSCNKQHFHWGAKVCKRWVKCSRQIMRSNSLR